MRTVFGRDANSGWVMSSPESTTVTGVPGPGASILSAPVAARHPWSGTRGSVPCVATLVFRSGRSGSATATARARRSCTSASASTRQIRSSGTSSTAPARRASEAPWPCFNCTSSALAGAALARMTAVTMISRRTKGLRVMGLDPAREARLNAMSHLDELDEFEAELELRLKKEYTAVFGLFRYCVLTQDATYLCNRLDLAQISQPNYPFFHLKMEDVWVWDKNRPTRIIPRAEVW